jgi:LuxR family maltose regulon positive regulatory protein
VSLDAARSWFRYHRLFADLLQRELRRTMPGEVPALHAAAAWWYTEHEYPVEAIRHAQAARDWTLAARLLATTGSVSFSMVRALLRTSCWPDSRLA